MSRAHYEECVALGGERSGLKSGAIYLLCWPSAFGLALSRGFALFPATARIHRLMRAGATVERFGTAPLSKGGGDAAYREIIATCGCCWSNLTNIRTLR